MTRKRKKGGRSRPERRDLFHRKRGAEPRPPMSWFSACMKQLGLFLRRNWVSVKGGLIFAGCILLFMFAYSKLMDAELLKPYCAFIASSTGFVLSLLGIKIQVVSTMLSSMDFSMGIIDICTGIVPMAILASAVLAYPCTMSEKGIGIALGIVVLFVLNLVRTVSLFLVGTYLPSVFDTVHYVVWQSLMILLAIGVWLFWMEKMIRVAPR